MKKILALILLIPLLAVAQVRQHSCPAATSATSVSDDFNRATLGANWTGTAATIYSSTEFQFTAGNSREFEYWSANTFANNQYSQVKLTAMGNGIGPAVRVTAADTGVGVDCSTPSGFCSFRVQNAGSNVVNNVIGAYTPGVGDIVRLEVSGTTYTFYTCTDATCSSKTQRYQITDNTLSSGRPGIFGVYAAAGARIDDWKGGDL